MPAAAAAAFAFTFAAAATAATTATAAATAAVGRGQWGADDAAALRLLALAGGTRERPSEIQFSAAAGHEPERCGDPKPAALLPGGRI